MTSEIGNSQTNCCNFLLFFSKLLLTQNFALHEKVTKITYGYCENTSINFMSNYAQIDMRTYCTCTSRKFSDYPIPDIQHITTSRGMRRQEALIIFPSVRSL